MCIKLPTLHALHLMFYFSTFSSLTQQYWPGKTQCLYFLANNLYTFPSRLFPLVGLCSVTALQREHFGKGDFAARKPDKPAKGHLGSTFFYLMCENGTSPLWPYALCLEPLFNSEGNSKLTQIEELSIQLTSKLWKSSKKSVNTATV